MASVADGRGIQSVETAYRVLLAIQAGSPASLKVIAQTAGLTAPATRNYLVSLLRTGMVDQVGRGAYQLGSSLAALGLAALRHVGGFDTVKTEADALCGRIQRSVAVVVWSEAGPVIIHHHDGAKRGAFDLRNGLVSCLQTGGGHVFLSFLDERATDGIALKEATSDGLTKAQARALIEATRRRVRDVGYAVCDLAELPGYVAISVPVWDAADRVAYALTVTGPRPSIEVDPDSDHVQALRASGRLLSRQLGAPPARWFEG